MAEELLQSLARDINCLSEDDRNARRRAIQKISTALLRGGADGATVQAVWDGAVRAPVLKALADPTEKIRETAIQLVIGVIDGIPDIGPSLPALVPTLAARVGSVPLEEAAEELRLELLAAARALVAKAGAQGAPYLKELSAVGASLCADPFPDVKKEVCGYCKDLAALHGAALAPYAAPLCTALMQNAGHQHSRVRALCFEAAGALLALDCGPLPELGPQIAVLAQDKTPAVRETVSKVVAELLRALPAADAEAHAPQLLPALLQGLCDEAPAVRERAAVELEAVGAKACPGADGDLPAVEHRPPADACAALPAPPLDPAFAAAPPWAAVQLAQTHLGGILPPALADLRDWTARGRLRAASTVVGGLWLARGAATDHLDALLPALQGAIDDDDPTISARVSAAAVLAGALCAPKVALAIATRNCAAEGATVSARAASLEVLVRLIQGAPPESLEPMAAGLAATLCAPHFCAAPVSLAEESTTARAVMQTRLVEVIDALVRRAPGAVAEGDVAYQLYCALMQLAATPTKADSDYVAQRRALAVLGEALAPAAGADGAPALHARFAGRLLRQVTTGEAIGAVGAGAVGSEDAVMAPAPQGKAGTQLVMELGGTEAAPAAGEDPAARAADDKGGRAPYAGWSVSSHEWHVAQAVCSHAPGEAIAAELLTVFPMLAAILEPSHDPPLRLTALTVARRLLLDAGFRAHPAVRDWAALFLSALVVPNLVWRAGRAAQQVRHAAALCLDALTAGEPAMLTPEEYAAAMPASLPVLRSALDDEGAETRLLVCGVLARVLPQAGPALSADDVRGLYPDLTKRLDDANDDVRLAVCPAIEGLLSSCVYDSHYRKPGSNLDETNLSYLVRSVLVHLDDWSPDIQAASLQVLRFALKVSVDKVSAEVAAVRDRHRSPKLCDMLLAEAREGVHI